MTGKKEPNSSPHLVANIFMILFMLWASFEALNDHKTLSALAYFTFSLAFTADALKMRQRQPYGMFIYYGLFTIALTFGVFSIFRRLLAA